MASFIGVKSLFYPVGLDCQTYPWWIAAAGVSPSVGLRPPYGETPAAILILIDAHSGPDPRAAVQVMATADLCGQLRGGRLRAITLSQKGLVIL